MFGLMVDAYTQYDQSADLPARSSSEPSQVCWEKYAAHYDVEARFCPMVEGLWVMQPEALKDLVDKNTVGVAAILGSTYTGHYEDVQVCGAWSASPQEMLKHCVCLSHHGLVDNCRMWVILGR